MIDRPVGDHIQTTYTGDIVLNAVPTEGDAPTPAVLSTATAAQRTSATSGRPGC
jgi:hypothetical protein